MNITDHKAVRRTLLEVLYGAYMEDPLSMVEPESFYGTPPVTPENIVVNMHYLHERKLVEMMLGYAPPMFSAARITTNGIDLVEDRFRLDLQFPKQAEDLLEGESAIPHLLQHLVAQGDLSPLDGWVRRQLLGDIQFLQEQLAQPRDQWRHEVIDGVFTWIDVRNQASGGTLTALPLLRNAVRDVREQGMS